ncbi:MAG: PorV/PorQ family protein [Flavobacteriales bacterium]|nr:PorV/PorQ family protein [Flavobacteriales bacterium]
MMRKRYKILFCFLLVALGVQAGNKDRSGQAGAYELLINPWASSSALGGSNTASVRGLEATSHNMAGLAFTKKTEVIYNNSQWLVGSDIKINALGISQKVGEEGVLGISLVSMSFGDILRTQVGLPEGGIGNYNVSFNTIGFSYAKIFSNSIYGGVGVKIISESLSDLSAKGVALDAGIQYVTGKMGQFKFGIALRNVGPRIQYGGTGLGIILQADHNTATQAVDVPSVENELPSLLNIGATYVFYFNPNDTTSFDNPTDHRLVVSSNFTSNSFLSDQIRVGFEYGFKKLFKIRAGYVYEEGLLDDDIRTTAYTGLTAGFGVDLKAGKGSKVSLEYSYRNTNPFNGSHTIGLRFLM